MPQIESQTAPPLLAAHRWNPRSVCLIVFAWLILHIGGLFTPGLLDDVDSVYLEIARQMLVRHDFVTPYIDGIRFFDKPPLMYWLASGSMAVFGQTDWAGRLPLALLMLALLLATYALGLHLFAEISPTRHPDRAAFYGSLALATSIGPYLYTRFFIPDIAIALWLTLAIHTFLIALHRIARGSSSLLPCLAFAAVTALNVLTKGLIGLVFPLAFVLLYLGLTRQLHLLFKLHIFPSVLTFFAIAAPWHILAALRNPAIVLPPGLGLPAQGGWAWFYLYNEHVARFLSHRIPHDYGQTPIWLFWLFTLIWIMPWGAFLPAVAPILRFRMQSPEVGPSADGPLPGGSPVFQVISDAYGLLLLWTILILGFFTLSARQEYYGLPALPALALLVGGALALADSAAERNSFALDPVANISAIARSRVLALHRRLLLPLATLIAAICGYFALTAPRPTPGTDLSTLLATNPDLYNLSLGHLFDLTGAAMGLFRGPLIAVAIAMAVIGPLSYVVRHRTGTYAANIVIAAGMILTLLATHEAFVRFNPILGSKDLADAIVRDQQAIPRPDDMIMIDGELTAGSTLLFYTREPVYLVNGRINGPWYGSFWPDAPAIFETDASLDQLWAGPRRLFLLTYRPQARVLDLSRFGPVHVLTAAGGKSVLTNQP